MNLIKEHKIANRKKGQVSFGSHHGGTWEFRVSDRESGAYTKIMKVRSGLKIAEKIAETLHLSWLRTAGKKLDAAARIDGRARHKIDLLVKVRTLKDYTGEPEFWSNDPTDEPTVKMINIHQQPEKPKGISEDDLKHDLPAYEPKEMVVTRSLEAALAALS